MHGLSDQLVLVHDFTQLAAAASVADADADAGPRWWSFHGTTTTTAAVFVDSHNSTLQVKSNIFCILKKGFVSVGGRIFFFIFCSLRILVSNKPAEV